MEVEVNRGSIRGERVIDIERENLEVELKG